MNKKFVCNEIPSICFHSTPLSYFIMNEPLSDLTFLLQLEPENPIVAAVPKE